ncbi:MAG: acylphosphatase [candidate division Zixibacteria bacterium]|nr:acylphosphatase [candidate division Zixibacteria bacterium]
MSYCRATIKCYGLVQGVGYRYYCNRSALAIGLTGWVKNCPDSTVELVVEGKKNNIEIILDELKIGPSSANVTKIDIKWGEYKNEFSGFEVRF